MQAGLRLHVKRKAALRRPDIGEFDKELLSGLMMCMVFLISF